MAVESIAFNYESKWNTKVNVSSDTKLIPVSPKYARNTYFLFL
jgi:hypothetical protein